jgi:multicomponent Na+:H+ antiporter subunit D
MARLWDESFWKPVPLRATSPVPQFHFTVPLIAPIAFLVSLTIALSALAGPVSALTTRAAEQLLDQNTYVRAVLGEEVPRAAR